MSIAPAGKPRDASAGFPVASVDGVVDGAVVAGVVGFAGVGVTGFLVTLLIAGTAPTGEVDLEGLRILLINAPAPAPAAALVNVFKTLFAVDEVGLVVIVGRVVVDGEVVIDVGVVDVLLVIEGVVPVVEVRLGFVFVAPEPAEVID